MNSRQNGFTLLEVCLALMIALLLITVALPGIAGALAEQRLKRSFEAFDGFVQSARLKSVHEQRDFVMMWDATGITLASVDAAHYPADKGAKENSQADRFTFDQGQTYALERSAALTDAPLREWVFWKNGICEPAEIKYLGDAGKWTVRYNPLTARGTFLDSEAR